MASNIVVFQPDATAEYIKQTVQGNQAINELVFKHISTISSEDLQSIVEHVNPGLDSLSIHNCHSFDDGCACKISRHCPQLTSVSFSGTCGNLSSVGISYFVENCVTLRRVTIVSSELDELFDKNSDNDDNDTSSDNQDNDKSWVLSDDIFASFLQRTDLEVEHFALCGFENITPNGLTQFLAHLGSHLTSLDVSELSAVNDDIVGGIGDICSNLQDVSFSHCKLTDKGIQLFCSKCKLLQSVNLSGCQDISDASIVALSTNCTSLRIVQLEWCLRLTEKSLDALLSKCHHLTFINMSQCAIKHIPFSLLNNLSLKELKVEGCTALKCPPLDLAIQSLESCREFLKKCHLQPSCRLTFLGNQGSGKTSLMASLSAMTQSFPDTSTEGVHVTSWKPFQSGKESVDLGTDVNEKMLSLTVEMWDCGGRSCLQGVHPLFLCEQSLYAIVFDVHDPLKTEAILQWIVLMRSKTPASPIILVGTHADSTEDRKTLSDDILHMVNEADVNQRCEVQAEIDSLRDLRKDKCIESRINKLEILLQSWPNVPEQVFFVSTLKGMGISELQHHVTEMLMDTTLFPHLAEEISPSIVYLYSEILQLRESNTMLLSWDHFLQIASNVGMTDESLQKATTLLESKGCILVFNIPSHHQTQGYSKIVCLNPSALLNCIAGILCETDPREYVPQFIKAGKLEMFWPTGARPNEWTLRAAIDDIVSKGFVRESVIPLCFQITALLEEEELQCVIGLFRGLGFLMEGAPKGNYDVELIMSQYKSCSVFKRYYIPLLSKLLAESEDTEIWPKSQTEGHIQVGWRYKFRDRVTVGSVMPLFIGACANLKPSCELCTYWNSGVILKIGPVIVRMSCDDTTVDMIGRCKITDGSKQALIMTWVVLAKYFYVFETLLTNYKGICPEVTVPIFGCNRPKHKPLYELVSEYNSQVNHHANYCWFIPPAALHVDEHLEIPGDSISWLANIACKSMLYISYHPDQQHEVKLLQMSLDTAGFDCVGDWGLAGTTGHELVEKQRKIIAGSSLFLAFITPQYLDWTRASQDVKFALSNNKPLVSVLFDKSTWESERHELGSLLKDNGVCLDLSAGSGTALSHQYDQGQVSALISYCNGTLYGTGDIHPPEPPRTPEHEAQVLNNANLDSSISLEFNPVPPSSRQKKGVEFSDLQSPKTDSDNTREDKKVAEEIRRMAAGAVAAAVAGATAQQIAKSKHSAPAVKAAFAAVEVAQAVANGNSDGAAQAVSKVAKIVEEENSRANASSAHNGSATGPPPKSATCVIF